MKPQAVPITLDMAIFFVFNCPKLRSWFIIPELGHRSLYANYDATDWQLSEVYDFTAVRSVRIYDREGIEIDRIPSWIFDSTTVSARTTYTLHLFGSTFWLWLGEDDKVFKR